MYNKTQKISLIISLVVSLAMSSFMMNAVIAASNGFFDKKFTKNQVFDTCINPEIPVIDNPVVLTRCSEDVVDPTIPGFLPNVDWGVNDDRYIKFSPSVSKSNRFPTAYSVRLDIYESNGNYVKTISNFGSLWDVRKDGFFYYAHDGLGYYFPTDYEKFAKDRTAQYISTGLITDGADLGTVSTSSPNPSLSPKPTSGMVSLKSILVSVSSMSLVTEETKAIKVSAVMSDNTRKDVTLQTDYFSMDTEVADVDDGIITGIAAGKTSISVNYKGLEKSITVEVRNPVQKSIEQLEASEKLVKLKAGQQMELSITGIYEDESREDLTGEVLWQSSKGSVATVIDGILTAKSIGSATITASIDGVKVQIRVIVEKAKKVKVLTITKTSLNLTEGQSAILKVMATYVDNSKEDVTTKVIWTIGDTEVVDVNRGKFYALDVGKSIVKGKFDTKLITVNVSVK